MFGLLETFLHRLNVIGLFHRLNLVTRAHTFAELHRAEFHHVLEKLYLLLHVLIGFFGIGIFCNVIVDTVSVK